MPKERLVLNGSNRENKSSNPKLTPNRESILRFLFTKRENLQNRNRVQNSGVEWEERDKQAGSQPFGTPKPHLNLVQSLKGH